VSESAPKKYLSAGDRTGLRVVTGEERFLSAQADPLAGSEWERENRPAPFGMTSLLGAVFGGVGVEIDSD
jgi:hypothetical protein